LPDGSNFNETATKKIRQIETAFLQNPFAGMKKPAAGLPARAM
jgi:hypothetical protein